MAISRSVIHDALIIMEAARKFVAGGWTTKTVARDDMGNGVSITSKYAVKFDLSGALRRAYLELLVTKKDQVVVVEKAHTEVRHFLLVTAKTAPYLSAWNDTPGRTQEDVLELLDEAIALTKARALSTPSVAL